MSSNLLLFFFFVTMWRSRYLVANYWYSIFKNYMQAFGIKIRQSHGFNFTCRIFIVGTRSGWEISDRHTKVDWLENLKFSKTVMKPSRIIPTFFFQVSYVFQGIKVTRIGVIPPVLQKQHQIIPACSKKQQNNFHSMNPLLNKTPTVSNQKRWYVR